MLAAQTPASALGLGRFGALDVEEPSSPRPAFRPPPARSLAAARTPACPAEARRAAFLARATELAAKDWPGGPPDAVRNFMLKMPTADGYAWITGDGVVWRRDILYTYGGGITLTHTTTDRAELERYDPWSQLPCLDHEARLHTLHRTTKPQRRAQRASVAGPGVRR